MTSIFSKIIQGEIPCHKVAETENCLAFLDIFPLKEGHTLVVPKKEIDYLFDIEDKLYQELFLFSKLVARAIEKTIKCKKIGVSVIGLEVPHAHIHLIPVDNVGDINFSKPKLNLTNEHMNDIATKIKQAFG